jgi:hypothetical protein
MLNVEISHDKWIKDGVQITSHAMNRIRKMFHLNYPRNAAANLVREHYLLGPIPVISIQILIPFLPDRFFGKNGLLVAPQAQ